MLSLNNIHPLTEFKRNASTYIEQVRKTLAPIVLTVNGKAAVVVQDAGAYQAMIDQLQAQQKELHELKRSALIQDLDVGLQQLDQGQYNEYTAETLPNLCAEIRNSGRDELGLNE